jgi:hypothetical protein
MSLSALSENERAALHEEIRREVKDELHREERIRLRWRLFWYFMFTAVPLVIVAVMVARTGLMRIPLLSSSLYHPVTPTRLVAPLVGETAEVAWRESLASAKFDKITGVVTMEMDENRLTTAIREGLAAQADVLPFKTKDAQIALDRGRAELFFFTERGAETVPVRMAFLPSVDRFGNLKVEVSEVIVGGAAVPTAMRAPMATLLNNFLRNEFTSQMPAGFVLRNFDVEPESMIVSFTAPQ